MCISEMPVMRVQVYLDAPYTAPRTRSINRADRSLGRENRWTLAGALQESRQQDPWLGSVAGIVWVRKQ